MSSKRQLANNVAKKGADDMAKVQNLRLRGKTYWYHRYIPKDVRCLFDGKDQLWISLRSQDFNEAKRLCLQLTLDHDERITACRTGQQEAASLFTDDYIAALAEAWAADWLRADEQVRMTETGHDGKQIWLLGIAHSPESLRRLILLETKDSWDGLSPFIASDWLIRQSVVMPRDSEAFKKLCYRIRQAALQALDSLKLRTEGVPVASPELVKVEAPKPKQKIDALLDPWKLRQKPKDSSVREFERAAARFNEKHPTLHIADVESLHIVEYRDWLTEQGLAAATVEKHMNAIKALLAIAVERNLIKHNPASRIRPPKASKNEEEDREPFSKDDLNKFFSSPIYRGGRIPAGGKAEAAQWLPLMALFSGARVEELCQLRLNDFSEDGGIPFFFIRRKHEEQDTKTSSSIRRVPVHPILIRIGLLRYVERLREAKDDWLFPLLVTDVKGNRSGNWSKWFGRYLRDTVKIKDPAIVFHSFRHTFKDVCRACSIPEDVHDAITGHRNGSVGREYGGAQYPLQPLSDAMKRYQVKELDLSHINLG